MAENTKKKTPLGGASCDLFRQLVLLETTALDKVRAGFSPGHTAGGGIASLGDRAIALALRVEKESDTLHMQVKRAVQLAFGRVPDKVEWESLKRYVLKMRAYHVKYQPEPVKYPTRITRSLVEELTGQPFEYEEILPVFDNYVPDEKPADVSANTRALADLCLLLFNSNEFIYVY